MAKSSLEKALEKHQKEIERQFKKKIYAEKKLANKQRQDSERQAKHALISLLSGACWRLR